MEKIEDTKLGPGLDFDPLEDKQKVSAGASNDRVMCDGYLPAFDDKPILASCDHCTHCEDVSDGLALLLEKWRKRSSRFEGNYQFGRDGKDDNTYVHGKCDMLDECIDELVEAMKG